MILLWWSTWTSGWAASIPSRASTTTSFGSLISFFMTSLSLGVCLSSSRGRRRGGRLWIGEVDALADGPVGGRVGDEAVGQGRDGTGEELGGQVDRELLPLHGAAGDLLDEHRAEGAGRVDGRTRGRGHGDDRGEDDQTDGDTGEPGGGLAVDHAEDREHQDERADELRGERLDPADAGVRRHP